MAAIGIPRGPPWTRRSFASSSEKKLANGGLPRTQTPRIWGGPSTGETCDGCGGTVTGAQMLMEGTLDALGWSVRFHVACFALWDAERQVLEHEPIGPA